MPVKGQHLRKGQFCPLHKSFYCCGRQRTGQARNFRKRGGWKAKAEHVAPGVWRIPDAAHPRGYRERREAWALQQLMNQKIIEQDQKCALCGELFDDYRQIVAEHIEPKGMGGGRRDDHPENIQAAHNWPCNARKGSKRPESAA